MKDKKQSIFDSTLDLVKDHGFEGTSMSMISRKAGVAAGTIYHYFDGKEMLITQLFDNVIDLGIETCNRANHPELTYHDRFVALWKEFYQFHIERPGVLKFYEQYTNSSYYMNHPRKKEVHKVLTSFFEEGISNWIIKSKNAELMAMLMIGNIIMASKVAINNKYDFGETELDEMIAVLWDGMTQCY